MNAGGVEGCDFHEQLCVVSACVGCVGLKAVDFFENGFCKGEVGSVAEEGFFHCDASGSDGNESAEFEALDFLEKGIVAVEENGGAEEVAVVLLVMGNDGGEPLGAAAAVGSGGDD